MKKLLMVLSIVLLLTTYSFGQNLGLNAIAPKVGVIMPEDPWDTGFLVGAQADMGTVAENLGLFPFVAYWSSGYDLLGVDLTLSNIQIGADVHYAVPNVQGLYAGGGLSFNILSIEFPSYNYLTGESTTDSDSESKIGFGFLAGYEIQLGGNAGFVEAKYNIISDLNTLEIAAGIYFDMTK